jgi:hypothetical protein
MEAEQRLRRSDYPPEVVEILLQAFNETWEKIGHTFTSQADIDDARDRLARIILAYASDGTTDLAAIKSTAVLVMQLNFPAITFKR